MDNPKRIWIDIGNGKEYEYVPRGNTDLFDEEVRELKATIERLKIEPEFMIDCTFGKLTKMQQVVGAISRLELENEQLKTELEHTREQIQRMNDVKKEVVSGVPFPNYSEHDTPLTRIAKCIQYEMEHGGDITAAAKAVLRDMEWGYFNLHSNVENNTREAELLAEIEYLTEVIADNIASVSQRDAWLFAYREGWNRIISEIQAEINDMPSLVGYIKGDESYRIRIINRMMKLHPEMEGTYNIT
jgi:hypothetical protein